MTKQDLLKINNITCISLASQNQLKNFVQNKNGDQKLSTTFLTIKYLKFINKDGR